MIDELADGRSVEDALACRKEAIATLIAQVDVVHLLGQLALSELALDPNTYVESENQGSAYVVELVAAVALSRPTREPTSFPNKAVDANVLEPARRLAQEAAMLESLRRARRLGLATTGPSAAQSRAAMRDVMLRAPGWPWQEHKVLRGLFSPEHIDRRVRQALGFGVEDAIAVVEAATKSIPRRLARYFERADQQSAGFGPGHPAFEWAEATLDPKWKTTPTAEQVAFVPLLWANLTQGDALLIEASELSELAGVPGASAAAVMRALSIPMGHDEHDWIRVADEVRRRPYIEVSPQTFLLSVPGNDLWALRALLEDAARSRQYFGHRGRWLEIAASDRLVEALRPTRALSNIKILDEDGLESGEIDSLLQFDDVVVCVEAKSATLRPSARRGGAALLGFLEDNLTSAVEQGVRARSAVREMRIRTSDGYDIALEPAPAEIHTIAVTLDDLSTVAPVIWQLGGTDLLPDVRDAPWVLTLHELDLICSTVEWPAQLVLFLRRRARLNEFGRYLASDELDWWMHFLDSGLYFEEATDLEQVRFASLTDPLDAWALFDAGLRTVPAPRPQMWRDSDTTALLTWLDRRRPRGWALATAAILTPSSSATSEVWAKVRPLLQRAEERQAVQRCRLDFPDPPHPMVLAFVVVPVAERWSEGRWANETCAELAAAEPGADVVVFGLSSESLIPRVVRTARRRPS